MSDPSDIGGRALNAAHNLFRRGQETAKREGRIIRLQTQMSRLKSRRQRLLYEMGEKVYDLFQRDLVKNQDLRMTCQQIKGIDAEIELRREEIEQLRQTTDTPGERGIDSEPEPAVTDLPFEDEEEIIRD